MQARILPFVPQLLDAQGRPMGTGRGAGLHLTEIIRYMREGLGAKFPTQGTGNSGFASTGFMFETWVEQALATYIGYDVKYLTDIGEIKCDGILMTPDRFHTRDQKIVEFKATWRSLRRIIDDDGEIILDVFDELFYYYRWQVMAYCKGVGCLEADLVIWFVNGDYSFGRGPNGGPQFRVIQMVFEPDEIEANWRAIVANGKALVRARKEGRA